MEPKPLTDYELRKTPVIVNVKDKVEVKDVSTKANQEDTLRKIREINEKDFATEETQNFNKGILTDIKAIFTNVYNQTVNWLSVKVLDSDKTDFVIPLSSTLIIEETKIKTFPVYSTWYKILGTLEVYGIFNLSSVGEVHIDGTIINEGLIIYS